MIEQNDTDRPPPPASETERQFRALDAATSKLQPPKWTLTLYAPECTAENLVGTLQDQAISRMSTDMPAHDVAVRIFAGIEDAADLARSMGQGEADIDLVETHDGKVSVHVNHHDRELASGRYVAADRFPKAVIEIEKRPEISKAPPDRPPVMRRRA